MRPHLHVMFGVPVDAVNMTEAIAAIDAAVAERRRLFISTPNLSFFTLAAADAGFRRSLFQSDLSLVDGAPVLWLAKLAGVPVPCRVPGSDLFDALRWRRPPGGRLQKVYFFGGPEGAAGEAAARINATATGLRCVGWHYPGYRSVDEMSSPETLAAINASGADLLVVALGARKGQEWLQRNLTAIDIPVRVHLGAVINFEAGRIRRAPLLFRRTGFEWLWRIREEPALFWRYVADFRTLARLGASAATGLVSRTDKVPDSGPFWMKHEADGACVTVTLSGIAGREAAGTLAAAFDDVRGAGRDTVLDCRDLACLGPAALGQVAALKMSLEEAGRALRFRGLSGQPLRACTAHGMAEILGLPAGERPQ